MYKIKYYLLIFTAAALFVASCNNGKNNFDASGSFEAAETVISSEVGGVIKQFDVMEGETIEAGKITGYIDSAQLYLKKKQLNAQVNAVLSRKPNIAAQLAALQEQLKASGKEQKRIVSLLQADAATQKQSDDVSAQIEVLKKQMEALQSSLGITSESTTQETMPLHIQIEQLNDQLSKCRLVNPLRGTVLAKYAEANEVTAPGKPLYKIADMSVLFLRAYITGNQLPQVKLNQKVNVLIDDGPGKYKEYEGTIAWISNKAEFTPKTIQTKEERANLVYAMKIKVNNDGMLKIGMYGEVKFSVK